MNFVFFDIECCDGHNMCSFGYVITDECFNILEKDDIVINPQHRFKLARAGFDPAIKLAYSVDEFKSAPTFSAFYERISGILTAPDTKLFGHSVESDMAYLDTACHRYNKKRLRLSAVDVQAAYSKWKGEPVQRKLNTIISDLGVDVSHLSEHKSCDDAEMTMLAAKSLCEKYAITSAQFISDNSDCIVSQKTIAAKHQNAEIKKTVKAMQKLYEDFADRKNIYISNSVIAKDIDGRRRLVRLAYKRGYGYTTDIAKCAYFVSNGLSTLAEDAFVLGADVKKISFNLLSLMLKVAVSGKGEVGIRARTLRQDKVEKRTNKNRQ